MIISMDLDVVSMGNLTYPVTSCLRNVFTDLLR